MFTEGQPHLISSILDALIGVVCVVITLGLFQRHRKFKNLQYAYLLFWFGLFILSCGLVALADLINLSSSSPVLWNVARALVAFSILVMAITLFPLRYRILKQRDIKLEEQYEKLRKSEERFRLLVESVKDYAIFMLDPEGHISTWNRGAKLLKGYEAHEIIGKHFSNFYPETDINAGKPPGELEIAKKVGRFEEEGWRIRKDKTRFWANVTITALRDPEGNLIGFAKVTRDLTERKNRDEVLRSSQAFLDSILENIPNMVFVKEAKTLRFMRFNRAGEQLLGYPRSALIGKNDYDFFPKEQADFFTQKDRDVLTGHGIVDIPEETIQTATGSRILHTRKIPILDADGKPEYLLGIAEDITDWKIAQEERLKVFGEKIALEEQEISAKRTAFFAEATTLLASSLDYHSTLNALAGALVQSLASWCTITLVLPDKTIDRVAARHRDPEKTKLLDVLIRDFPVVLDSKNPIAQVIRTGVSRFKPLVSEDELAAQLTNDRHVLLMRELGTVSSIIVPIKIRDVVHGAISLISSSSDKFFSEQDLAIAEEIAKRAATAIENAKLYEAAQQAVQSRDEFLSIASHELKTPLTALKLQLEFARRLTKPELNQAPSPEKSAKMLDTSTAQVNRLVVLVDDLLDVSRIEAGKLNFNFEAIDLAHLVHEVAERYRDHLTFAGSTLSVSIPDQKLMVYGDRFRLEQVILNILSNAAKYGSKKPIELRVLKVGDSIRVSCQDHGIGIPESKLEKIFERFERAIAASNISGLGLGLYIAKEIVVAHGGEIWAESAMGSGSCFNVNFPEMKDAEKEGVK